MATEIKVFTAKFAKDSAKAAKSSELPDDPERHGRPDCDAILHGFMLRRTAAKIIQLRKAVAIGLLWTTVNLVGLRLSCSAQTPDDGRDAKACKLMPTAELEASYHGKATKPRGMDGEYSICTVNIGGLAVKVQSSPPGAAGVPTTIAQGLMGARLMLAEAKQSPRTNTMDFGNIGCLSIKMKKGFDGEPLAKPLLTTSCFLVDGGYLNMSVASENAKQLRFEAVKALLESAAAKR